MKLAAAFEIELTITGENIDTTRLKLGAGEYLIGRAKSCYIRFPENYRLISRQHAKLVVQPGQVTIQDLDSSGGTMVDGRFVTTTELCNGSEIAIGNIAMKIRLPEEEREASVKVDLSPAMNSEDRVQQLDQRLRTIHQATERVMREVRKRIIGQEHILRATWATILARGHCLLIGVPGLAKTYLVKTFGEVLGLSSKRIQFTPDLMPSDILGSNILQVTEEGRRHMEFIQGPIFTQLLLADEINRTPPKTQAALLEAMQERQVTIADKSRNLPTPFFVIATQNPIEQEGTYPLPEAQQDRFMLCIYLDYPQRPDEVEILLRTTDNVIPEVEAVLNANAILDNQRTVDEITVSRETAEFAVDLVRRTRPDANGDGASSVSNVIEWGAGPRAGQSLLRIAKALAAMDGRPTISRQDILEMAVPVLRHRICCNYKARAEGLDEAGVIGKIIEEAQP